MATEIKLPQWAMTLSEGTITEWKKNEGDAVAKGEVLCIVEEAKATGELKSSKDGYVLKICVQEGDTVPVLSTICIVGQPGEAI